MRKATLYFVLLRRIPGCLEENQDHTIGSFQAELDGLDEKFGQKMKSKSLRRP